jgi:hypothetical protein
MVSIPNFTPANWYWIVGGSVTQVYSSAVGDFVAVSNPTYQTWLAAGNPPTTIDTEELLGGVLAAYSLRPIPAGILDGYTETQSTKLAVEIVAKVLFWCVNEIRVLKGQPQVTPAQFKAFLKSLM